MNGERWEAPISDDAEQLLLRLMDAHSPRKGGWCACGRPMAQCHRQDEYGVQLAIAGRQARPLPWATPQGSGGDQRG